MRYVSEKQVRDTARDTPEILPGTYMERCVGVEEMRPVSSTGGDLCPHEKTYSDPFLVPRRTENLARPNSVYTYHIRFTFGPFLVVWRTENLARLGAGVGRVGHTGQYPFTVGKKGSRCLFTDPGVGRLGKRAFIPLGRRGNK